MDFDIAVIGAGVVGLACAKALSECGFSVVVIERHHRNGQETSSRNSCVIHAGMYYPPGSIKAELCFRANQKLYEYCQKKNIPHNKIGKYIVAVNTEEDFLLDKILSTGQANGVEGLQRVTAKQVQQDNPVIACSSALFSLHTGIIDAHAFMNALEEDALRSGCTFAYAHELVTVERNTSYTLSLRCNDTIETIETAAVINAAGLDSDRVAGMAGIDIEQAGYRLYYCRGHYFSLNIKKSRQIKNLIYPVPPQKMTGLGVHITLDLEGKARLGPDTEYLNQRKQDYAVNPDLRQKFYEAARWYFPTLSLEDLMPDYAGIRPKLQGPNDPYRDFVIQEESARGLPGWVNLIGIESPGLTCALEIAEKVKNFF